MIQNRRHKPKHLIPFQTSSNKFTPYYSSEYHPDFCAWILEMVSSLLVFQATFYTYFIFLMFMVFVLHCSLFSIQTPKHYKVISKNCKAHYKIFSIPLLLHRPQIQIFSLRRCSQTPLNYNRENVYLRQPPLYTIVPSLRLWWENRISASLTLYLFNLNPHTEASIYRRVPVLKLGFQEEHSSWI